MRLKGNSRPVKEEENMEASDVKKRSAGFGYWTIRLALPCLIKGSTLMSAESVDLDVDLRCISQTKKVETFLLA
jgi:hypothetical protein